MENSMKIPQKLKIELLHDSAIPVLGTYSKEIHSVSQSYICTPMPVAALVTIAKIRKSKSHQWMEKMWYIYSVEYYAVIEKNGNPVICNKMNELGGYYIKWNKSDWERQQLNDITYIDNL